MSIYRRRLMIANALKKSDSNINYPGLIAAWSAKGKSNDDADRAVLRDLTGNGYDLTLNGFAFNTEGSGYGHPEYPDALVFDGVDDYGVNSDMPILTDYTFIVKREILDDFSTRAMVASYSGNPTLDAGPFWFEYARSPSQINTYSFGKATRINLNKSKFVSYQTKSKYNGKDISFNDSLSSGKRMTIGGFYAYRGIDINMAFYSAYLFDRSLDEQEIKAFIRKYIDADYLLPSEQTTE
jgi:hypothetical protein